MNCHTPRSPSTPSKAPTEPQPFDLESPRRHEDYVNFRFPEKLAKEEEMRREKERQARHKEVLHYGNLAATKCFLFLNIKSSFSFITYKIVYAGATRCGNQESEEKLVVQGASGSGHAAVLGP